MPKFHHTPDRSIITFPRYEYNADRTEIVAYQEWDGSCQQFALCDNAATELVPHPILGAVPSCSRCFQRLTA